MHNEFVERRRSFVHLSITSGVETFAVDVGSSFSREDVLHPLWDNWIGHPLSFKVVYVLSELAVVCRVCGNFLYQAIQRWADCDDREESQRRETTNKSLQLRVRHRQTTGLRDVAVIGRTEVKVAQTVCSRRKDVADGDDDRRLAIGYDSHRSKLDAEDDGVTV